MKFEKFDDAYSAIARYLQVFVGFREWNAATCTIKVFKNMAKGEQYFECQGKIYDQGGFESDPDVVWDGLDAAIFLRDLMLNHTGHRIWGLKFTLFPNGKFDIEYDYSKPADYDETGESISGEEINAALNQIGSKI